MPDLKKYWQDLRALENTLPDYVWLMGGGSIVQVGAAVAARLLYAKSHRLATEDETQKHIETQKEIQHQQFQQRLRDKGIAVVPLD